MFGWKIAKNYLAGQLWLGLEQSYFLHENLIFWRETILWRKFFVVAAGNSFLNLAESREPCLNVHGIMARD
jgi:hypothetical protein